MTTECTMDQKREMFEAWEKAKAKLGSSASALNTAIATIDGHMGKGPFVWKGQELTVVKSGEKYSMRVKSKTAEEIG